MSTAPSSPRPPRSRSIRACSRLIVSSHTDSCTRSLRPPCWKRGYQGGPTRGRVPADGRDSGGHRCREQRRARDSGDSPRPPADPRQELEGQKAGDSEEKRVGRPATLTPRATGNPTERDTGPAPERHRPRPRKRLQGLETDNLGPQDIRGPPPRGSPGCGQTRLHPPHPPRPSPRPPPLSAAAATRSPEPGPAPGPRLPGSAAGHVLPEGHRPTGFSWGGGFRGPPPCPVTVLAPKIPPPIRRRPPSGLQAGRPGRVPGRRGR